MLELVKGHSDALDLTRRTRAMAARRVAGD